MKHKIIVIILICMLSLTGLTTVSLAKTQISKTSTSIQKAGLKEETKTISSSNIGPSDVKILVTGIFTPFFMRLYNHPHQIFPDSGMHIFLKSNNDEYFSCNIYVSICDGKGNDIMYYDDIFPYHHSHIDSDGFGIGFPLDIGFGMVKIDVHLDINGGEFSKDLTKSGFRIGQYVIII